MKTVTEALYDTIHRGEKPLKAIAEEIGVSENYLTRSALPDAEDSDTGTGCRFPLKKLIPLIRATNDYQVLDAIEHSLGRCGVLLPPQGRASTAYTAAASIKAIGEFGELLKEIERSVKDRKITSSERENIRREGYQAIQSILQLMASCEVKL